MTQIFAIADQQDERWNRFHRQAQDKRDSWASLRVRSLEWVGYDEASDAHPDVYRCWTGAAVEKQQMQNFAVERYLDKLRDLIDADELVDAEDLVRKYKGD